MKLAQLLGQPARCPDHPNYLVEDHGRCVVCNMTTHKAESGFKLIPDPPEKVWGNPRGRWVQEGADHDPEDRTLIWEPEHD